jgi:hypothetical protein
MTMLSPACARMSSECARARLALAPVAPQALHLVLVPSPRPWEGM